MLKAWTSRRLHLRQLGPHQARLVVDYGERAREFHRQWDPVRPDDYWKRRVVAERLAYEVAQARADSALILYLSTHERPDHIIGRVAVSNIIRGVFQSCTAGYGLSPDAVGQGYMTEGLSAMIGIAIRDLGLHRVEVNIIPRNEKSLAVARRCGMREEGTALRYLYIAGAWEDHIRFALTSEEIA